jgi:hypothetical protein
VDDFLVTIIVSNLDLKINNVHQRRWIKIVRLHLDPKQDSDLKSESENKNWKSKQKSVEA